LKDIPSDAVAVRNVSVAPVEVEKELHFRPLAITYPVSITNLLRFD
jgi:hypothetical protein